MEGAGVESRRFAVGRVDMGVWGVGMRVWAVRVYV